MHCDEKNVLFKLFIYIAVPIHLGLVAGERCVHVSVTVLHNSRSLAISTHVWFTCQYVSCIWW